MKHCNILETIFPLNSTKRTNKKEKVLPIAIPDKLLGRDMLLILSPFFTQHFCFSQKKYLPYVVLKTMTLKKREPHRTLQRSTVKIVKFQVSNRL